jgi:hypothetical protein
VEAMLALKMGISRRDAIEALRQNKGNVDAAMDFLLSKKKFADPGTGASQTIDISSESEEEEPGIMGILPAIITSISNEISKLNSKKKKKAKKQ